MKEEIACNMIEESMIELYKFKDYPLNFERIIQAIDRGGGQTVNVSGVLEALNEAGYIIKMK